MRYADFSQYLAGCVGPCVGRDHKNLPELAAQTGTPLRTIRVDTRSPNGMAPNLVMPKGPLCPTANQPSLRPASSPALSGFEHVFPPTSCWAERHHPSAPVKHHWAVRHQWHARSGAGHVTCLWMLRWGPVQRYHPHRTAVQTTAPACPIPPQRCLLGNGCGCSSKRAGLRLKGPG